MLKSIEQAIRRAGEKLWQKLTLTVHRQIFFPPQGTSIMLLRAFQLIGLESSRLSTISPLFNQLIVDGNHIYKIPSQKT